MGLSDEGRAPFDILDGRYDREGPYHVRQMVA